MNNTEMKNSGFQWIGEIPQEWTISKLKYCCDIIMGQSPSSDDIKLENGKFRFMQGNAEFTNKYPIASQYCDNPNKVSRVGDILMSVRAPVGEVNISDQQYAIGRGLCSIKAEKIVDGYLWYFLIKSKADFGYFSNGSTFDAITTANLLNCPIVVPSKEEQIVISKFLDKKCYKIDSIINDLEKQIEILEKYKKSVITEAVTKGLNANVEMKDSGEVWIGKIPIHWNTTRVKFLVNINNGREIDNDEGEIPVYGSGGLFKTTDNWLFNGDSVLLGRKGTVDIPQFVTGKFWTVDTAFYTDFTIGILAKYFYYLSGCFDYDKYQSGSTIPSMTQTALGNIVIPKVSIDEQAKIVEFLDKKCANIDSIIKDKQKQLETIKSYKNSLVYEYVTGKKRVSQGDVNE